MQIVFLRFQIIGELHPTKVKSLWIGVSRQRSATTVSILTSGISARLGVWTLNRLSQHAIQEIKSPAGIQSSPETNTCADQILAHNQAKELKETVKAATKPPESLFPNWPRLDSSPIAITATISSKNSITHEATKHSVSISKPSFGSTGSNA